MGKQAAVAAGNGEGNGAEGQGAAAAKAQKERQLVTVSCTLVGMTPIKPQAITEEKILDIMRKFKAEEMPKGLSREEARDWLIENVAKPCLYERGGVYGLPSKNLLGALVEGGRYVPIGRNRFFTGGSGSQVPGNVTIIETFLPFPEQCQEWEFDLDHGWGQTGTFVGIARPRFDEWALRTTLLLDVSEHPLSKYVEIFRQTGLKVGLGGHRPACKGPYGRFEIAEWLILADAPKLAGAKDAKERAKSYTYPTVG